MTTTELRAAYEQVESIGGPPCRLVAILRQFVTTKPSGRAYERLLEAELALGQDGEAWDTAQQCATRTEDPKTREKCRDAVAALDSKRASLSILVGSPTDGARWFVDGEEIDTARGQVSLWPGPHAVAVFVPHRQCCWHRLDVAPKDAFEVDLTREVSERSCRVVKVLRPD